MYLLLIFLPFISSISAGLFGLFLGSKGSAVLTVSCIFVSFIISVLVFYEVALMNCSTYIKLTTWISSEVFNVNWGFMFDSLTASMCILVTFISFLVHLYSTEYMSHDPHLSRFMSYLSLFTFFMLILITADNYIQMFVGWEGVLRRNSFIVVYANANIIASLFGNIKHASYIEMALIHELLSLGSMKCLKILTRDILKLTDSLLGKLTKMNSCTKNPTFQVRHFYFKREKWIWSKSY